MIRGLIAPLALLGLGLGTDDRSAAQSFGSTVDQTIESIRGSTFADKNMTPIRSPGDYRFSFIRDRQEREYRVYVPRSYDRKPMPVLIALAQDYDGPASALDWDFQLTRKAEQAGFVVILPKGYEDSWNAGRCCGPSQSHDIDEVGFIREVIDRVARQASIDRTRIFAAGLSNGAMMSWRLACELPEIRAIAPVAGTDNTTNCRPTHPVGVIQFHAADDRDVPFNGGKGRQSIGRIDFTSVPASQEKWIGINRASPTPTRVLAVRGAYCDLHPPEGGGAPVQLCVTEKGRHDWPGKFATIRVNDLMWVFFSSL